MSDQDYLKTAPSLLSSPSDRSFDMDERQMRETLGLAGATRTPLRMQAGAVPKARHRFVQDGEVPVIHLTSPRDGDAAAGFRGRIAGLEAALEAEQAARAKAEQAAQAATVQAHAMATKLAHVELALREELAAERIAREAAEAALRDAIAARQASPQPPAAAKKERVKRPRAAAPRLKEPKPVKWWLGKNLKAVG